MISYSIADPPSEKKQPLAPQASWLAELDDQDLLDYANPTGKIQTHLFFMRYNVNVAGSKYKASTSKKWWEPDAIAFEHALCFVKQQSCATLCARIQNYCLVITSLYDATPGRLFIIHHQNTCGLVQTSFTVGKAPWLAQFHEHGSSALAWEGVVQAGRWGGGGHLLNHLISSYLELSVI